MDSKSLYTDDVIIEILKRQGNTILRVAFSYMKNMSESEDIYQEVFLKLMKHPIEFQSIEHEKAYLIRMTINLCKNQLRSFLKNRVTNLEDDLPFNDVDISNGIDVFNAVLSLHQKYHTIIHFFYYEGYTSSEISEILSCSEASVRTSLHRARKILEKKLKGVVFDA
ncbi:MAG: sigma-70 family RNA polymerase sigma factor [Bacillota bacterium]|nr:sigma-70 family RNA polymerase sigma factor [Bacillota bacterium]